MNAINSQLGVVIVQEVTRIYFHSRNMNGPKNVNINRKILIIIIETLKVFQTIFPCQKLKPIPIIKILPLTFEIKIEY